MDQKELTTTTTVRKRRRVGTIRLIISSILLFITALTWGLFWTGEITAEEVIGISMEPTITRGDRVLVLKYHGERLERGQIVVVDPPSESSFPLIKRIVGVPGDTIRVFDERVVYVNREPTIEDLKQAEAWPPTEAEIHRLGLDQYFVVGDNVDRSFDSTEFGPIKQTHIIGRAVYRYSPFSKAGWLDKIEDIYIGPDDSSSR